MKEKRLSKRYEAEYKVIYKTREYLGREIKTFCFNLSKKGIGIYIRDFIKNTDRIELKIYEPHRDQPISLVGEVVWQSGLPWKGADRAGIKFLPKHSKSIYHILLRTVAIILIHALILSNIAWANPTAYTSTKPTLAVYSQLANEKSREKFQARSFLLAEDALGAYISLINN